MTTGLHIPPAPFDPYDDEDYDHECRPGPPPRVWDKGDWSIFQHVGPDIGIIVCSGCGRMGTHHGSPVRVFKCIRCCEAEEWARDRAIPDEPPDDL